MQGKAFLNIRKKATIVVAFLRFLHFGKDHKTCGLLGFGHS
ncbi:hypothetical protein PAECIP111894_04334 [Paenibacillus pseudetheri]|uniref:Uncharacterized protein n=1 Tax=Paenibacillus pseudetheri TaxID=2897682 RepID=A0ABM9BHV4_9BACL|nr:hypothetical protein PAECIP111894_04334 [Paenibacillus pseudetheri]